MSDDDITPADPTPDDAADLAPDAPDTADDAHAYLVGGDDPETADDLDAWSAPVGWATEALMGSEAPTGIEDTLSTHDPLDATEEWNDPVVANLISATDWLDAGLLDVADVDAAMALVGGGSEDLDGTWGADGSDEPGAPELSDFAARLWTETATALGPISGPEPTDTAGQLAAAAQLSDDPDVRTAAQALLSLLDQQSPDPGGERP